MSEILKHEAEMSELLVQEEEVILTEMKVILSYHQEHHCCQESHLR